jgi:Zn-finger protein
MIAVHISQVPINFEATTLQISEICSGSKTRCRTMAETEVESFFIHFQNGGVLIVHAPFHANKGKEKVQFFCKKVQKVRNDCFQCFIIHRGEIFLSVS